VHNFENPVRLISQGEVTTPSYPEALRIIKFKNRNGVGGAPAFIEVRTEWNRNGVRGAPAFIEVRTEWNRNGVGGAPAFIEVRTEWNRNIFLEFLP
jgi:hypothetical protein